MKVRRPGTNMSKKQANYFTRVHVLSCCRLRLAGAVTLHNLVLLVKLTLTLDVHSFTQMSIAPPPPDLATTNRFEVCGKHLSGIQ